MDWNAAAVAMAIASALVGAQWAFLLWINRQFQTTRALVYDTSAQTREDLHKKLEYHEEHDDRRFNQIRNDIWEVRLTNAARYGLGRPSKAQIQKGEDDNGSESGSS